MRGIDFIFDSLHLLFYKSHKVNPDQNRSYIDTPNWIKKQQLH